MKGEKQKVEEDLEENKGNKNKKQGNRREMRELGKKEKRMK